MSRKRTIATLAALGGFTAGLALLSAAPIANADELSDLRANQELLQRRLDQLAAAATAAPVAPGAPSLAGSFPRSFLIPGTDTSIAISGFVRLSLDWFLSGAGPGNGINGEPNNTIAENGALLTAPLSHSPSDADQRNHARSTGNFDMNVRESRLRVETRTPTAWGPAGTVFEFDWALGGDAGSGKLHVPDSIGPRLRLAYGTLGPWLAGQAYSLFNDLESHPTTLDFGGEIGESGTVRPPQLRYTWKGPIGTSFAASIEAPDTTLITPIGAIDRSTNGNLDGLSINPTKNAFPDVVGAFYWNQPWGHFSVRGVMTDDEVNDGRFLSRSFIGYGGAVSGSVKPLWFGFSKDVITWGFSGGVGMQRYLNGSDTWELASNMLALPTTQAQANAIVIRQTTGWQGHVGYEHWWAEHLRSDASFGIQHKDFPTNLLVGVSGSCVANSTCRNANNELVSTHLNLVYSPVSFVDTGVEWVYGHRFTNAHLRGDLNVIIGQVTVKF